MNEWFDAEQHVERAHEFYEASRWEEAESELRRAIALNPHRADWHFNLGLTLEAAGRFREALRAYGDAKTLEPESVQTLLAMGVNHLRLDDARTGAECLEEAHRLDQSRAEPLVHLIDARACLGQHDEAEVAFYMAMQLEDVDDSLAYLHLSGSLMDRELYEKAVWCLREAAQIDPRLPRVHARLAEAYAATGRKERARQLYLRELRNNPGDVETLLDLGSLLIDMNRLGEAGEKFRRVLELESDNADAHYALGDLALRQRRDVQALAAFRLVLRLDPDHSRARMRSAEILLRHNEREDARRLLRREIADLRRDPELFDDEELRDLGGLLLDAGLCAEAADAFRALAQRDPLDAEAHHLLGVSRFRMGDRAAGVMASRRALKLNPNQVSAMHNIALACIEERRWTRARCWVRRALAIEPDDASLRRLRVKLALRTVRQSGSRTADLIRSCVSRGRSAASRAA
ncbi:MAG: hypothetical protein EA376_10055 [Phycisphaeraceae bacterium]|nr:MAG: hypothetical protein EA376_10055 [Phycisphaeraceae bacterium]